MAISADTPEETRAHLAKMGWTYTFLSDTQGEALRSYDLLHSGVGADGRDVARPAEILIDPTGTVRWIDLTEDYRVRARPEEVLEVFDEMAKRPAG